MSVLSLSDYEEQVFDEKQVCIIGIVCTIPGFVLAGKLNRYIKTDFAKEKDFFLWNKTENTNDELESFYCNDPYHSYKYLLIETNNKFPTAIKAWKAYDFALMIIGDDNVKRAKEVISKLNEVEGIKILQILHPTSEKESTKTSEQNVLLLNLLGDSSEFDSDSTPFNTATTKSKPKEKTSKKLMDNSSLNNLLIDLKEYAEQIWENEKDLKYYSVSDNS